VTLAVLTSLCGPAAVIGVPAAAQPRAASRPAGWNESTHGASVPPDYARLFALDRVHELHITIPAASFAAMQEDLKAVTPGAGRGGAGAPPFGPGGLPPILQELAGACSGKAPAAACSVNGVTGRCTQFPPGPAANGPDVPLLCMPADPAAMLAQGRGGGAGRAIQLTTRDPMYVAVTVAHGGRTWTRVGMRFKGNSSLVSASVSGNGKIPFRLDFDRYEDEFPETRNQRFYGFQKLTFSSNFGDDSQLREVFANEVFRDRGVPAPRAAFYRIVVDTGAGPEYWGLYTMVEDPADPAMLRAQFGSDRGNLYKPDGPGADWTHFDREGFPKKTNEQAADFSDVEAAMAALHAPSPDPAAWRARLEGAFDVDLFLRWLAVNTALQQWDAYGVMAHNYYLYGDPAQKGRLRWIPWDNNFSLGAAPFPPGGQGARPGGPRGAAPGMPPPGTPRAGGAPPPAAPRMGGPFVANADVLYRDVRTNWPLIQKLLGDEVYNARYRAELARTLEGLFAVETAAHRLRELHALISPAVVGERGERPTHTTISSPAGFTQAVSGPGGLIEIIARRHETVRTALASGR
jgi:hypothetical protein